MTLLLPMRYRGNPHRVMLFVDGENIAMRFNDHAKQPTIDTHVKYKKDVYVWSALIPEALKFYNIVRSHFYTAIQGDENTIAEMEDEIRKLGIDAPRVFKKQKGRSSKRVDVTLVTDLLNHAYRDNFDVAIVVSGDGDFVPAIRAVQSQGKFVVLWAMPNGLSDLLRRTVDFYYNLAPLLTVDRGYAHGAIFSCDYAPW